MNQEQPEDAAKLQNKANEPKSWSQPTRRHPSAVEMQRWATRQQVLLEWRRLESDEPNWKRTQHISQSLSGTMKKLLPNEELPCAEDLHMIWKQVAGEFNALHSRPVSWHRQDLIIEVSHPALRFELQQHQAKLLEGLRRELEPAKIRAIRFRLIG